MRKLLTRSRIAELTVPNTVVGDLPNLWLRVGPTGRKAWLFRYMLNGVRHEAGLGSYDLVSLDEARQISIDFRKLLREGINPIDHRKQNRQAKPVKPVASVGRTFETVSEEYIASHKARWSRTERVAAEWRNELAKYAKAILFVPIDKVDTQAVVTCLKAIWTEQPKLAARLRSKIEAILGYATANNERNGDNPARWPNHLQNLLPKLNTIAVKVHHESLAYSGLPLFMARLQLVETQAARAVAFCVLTATRSGEARAAEWSEIDFDKRIWTIPACRMKKRIEHSVPLSDKAVALLERQERIGPYVFPGRNGKPMPDAALLVTVQGIHTDYKTLTLHGFRATFKTWCGEATNYPREVAEHALAHAVGNAVEQAYNRTTVIERRRPLMQDWAAFAFSRPIFTAQAA